MTKLAVVGLGPGGAHDMTVRAIDALEACDLIVGYTTYIELIADQFADKEMLSTPMRKEEKSRLLYWDIRVSMSW